MRLLLIDRRMICHHIHYRKERSKEILTLGDKAVGYIHVRLSAGGFYCKPGRLQQIRLPSECSEPLFFECL